MTLPNKWYKYLYVFLIEMKPSTCYPMLLYCVHLRCATKYLPSLQSRGNFDKPVLSVYWARIMATIFDFNDSERGCAPLPPLTLIQNQTWLIEWTIPHFLMLTCINKTPALQANTCQMLDWKPRSIFWVFLMMAMFCHQKPVEKEENTRSW